MPTACVCFTDRTQAIEPRVSSQISKKNFMRCSHTRINFSIFQRQLYKKGEGGMHKVILFVFAGATIFASFAQKIWITSPSQGDILYINDTISIRFEADSAYLGQASSTVIKISANAGFEWAKVCPLEDTTFCPVPVAKEYWGSVSWVIPESIYVGTASGMELRSALSDSVLFRVYDYGDRMLKGYSDGYASIQHKKLNIGDNDQESKGCGAGVATAFLIPLYLRITKKRKYGKRNQGATPLCKR
jgi:hypothetical protein